MASSLRSSFSPVNRESADRKISLGAPLMNTRTIASIFGSTLLVTLLASAAPAQVQRTFVSGLGNDANPCSRTAPCRTFTQAMSQTNSGGEVIVLDSAGYGPTSIT